MMNTGSFQETGFEMRIILLGKNSSEISRVGNFILGRDAFNAKTPAAEQHSERAGGIVQGRSITLINTHHLFFPQLSVTELTEIMKECMALSSPGPHVLLLVLQPDDFTETDRHRLNFILRSLSVNAHKHILLLTTQKDQSDSSVDTIKENIYQKIITEYRNIHVEFNNECSCSDLVTMTVQIIEKNGGSHLNWEEYEDAVVVQEFPLKEETLHTDSVWEKSKMEKLPERLNLVVCGSDGAVSFISELILGQKELNPESRSVCVRREGEVSGSLVTLVELPALYNSQLSEVEVMRKTLHCVSLCDPGVHAFLLILPERCLTDEDKREVEKIQMILGSRFNNYTIALINTEIQQEAVLDDAIKNITDQFVCVSETNIRSMLLQKVQQMMEQNSGSCYTTNMYLEAQVEAQLKYKSEIEELKKTINDLSKNMKVQTESTPDTGDLRIVLLGKTGVGKSATGNTILGNKKFTELLSAQSVTKVCQKESAEIKGREVSVIDTPGLFDTNINNEEVIKEIAKCVAMAAPGPHVFLLVLAAARFTDEEKNAVKMIQDLFGEESRKYTMVLFTKGDDLQETTIEDFIKTSDRNLENIIYQCGHRYHVFNNRNREDSTQVIVLLEKINSMVSANTGSCYTNEMFQNTEKALRKEQERILKEREKEIEREKEELRAKHEAELEKLKKNMEEERQKQDEERKIREREFKEKEEQITREFAEKEQIEKDNYNKRREEDEQKMKVWMAEINREREINREQFEKQREEDQKRRDQEEKERKKKEEEWKMTQNEEKEKFQQEKEEMKQKQKDDQNKLQQEYEQKKQEEEKRRRDLEEKIKHSEESKKKELQELQVAQQKEWEKREQEEKKRKEEQEEEWRKEMKTKEKEWQFQQNQKQQLYEQERKTETEKRTLEEEKRRVREEEEKKRIESEANEKIQNMQSQMALQRQQEVKECEEKHKKEMEERLRTQREEYQRDETQRQRIRREDEERNIAFMRNMHEEEMAKLRKETEKAARQEAEQEFCIKLDKSAKDAKEDGRKEGYIEGKREGQQEVEAQRSIAGKGVDAVVNTVCTLFGK